MQVDLWDISKMQKVRTFIGHRASVSALSWNSHLLSTGGADRVILHRDMRVPDFSVARLQGHRGHIAGLKVTLDCPKYCCPVLQHCGRHEHCAVSKMLTIHLFQDADEMPVAISCDCAVVAAQMDEEILWCCAVPCVWRHRCMHRRED